MSEGKRVSLQSIGPAKKDKKCKSTCTTIRLNLTLPTCNSDSFADFNYHSLILNERRKKEKNKEKDDKVNGGPTLDPYASDDEDDIRQIARSFESKYGTPKKKCRRFEDYTELGTGYDENDSFIDNTDAYDEVVPEDQTPELDGFYINKGQLVLKRVDGRSSSDQSDSDESEGPQNPKSQKRPLSSSSSSESESSSSGSSDNSDDSDGSEDSEEEDDEGNEETEIETEETPKEAKNGSKEIKEERSNGHVTSPVAKKSKVLEVSSKKAKSKAITGLFLKKAVTEKEHNEKRFKIDSCETEPNAKRMNVNLSEREPIEKHVSLESEVDVKRISSVDAAIEAVARGEDSKESGIAESKSHSGSSDDSDPEEQQNVAGGFIANGLINGHSDKHASPPLPAELPSNVLTVISALKEVAIKNSNLGKQQFFTSEVNSLLLRFEKLMRTVPRDKKGGVYDHLEHFLPCRKETLIKRGKALLSENVEAGFKEPLQKLQTGIASLMPTAIERYLVMCKKYESHEMTLAPNDVSKTPLEKSKTPRRRFPWTEDLKNILCLAVKKRRVYYGTVKQKGETWEDHLREFLKSGVLPMWEIGWMKVTTLLDIISKINPDLLQFKPMSPMSKMKKNTPCPTSKKIVLNLKKTVEDTVKSDVSSKKLSSTGSMALTSTSGSMVLTSTTGSMTLTSTTGSMALNSKPLQSVNHQSLSNSVSVMSSETGVKKSQIPQSGPQTTSNLNSVQPGTLPSISQTSTVDPLGSEFAECIRTSLVNSLVSVTPVQTSSSLLNHNNQHVPASSAPSRKSISGNIDIINLKSNGLDATVDLVHKKRLPLGGVTTSGQLNLSTKPSSNSDLQDLSKPQTSCSTNVMPSLSSQHLSHQSSPAHNPIKVSTVSAINLKLSGSQTQLPQAPPTKTNPPQPLKTSNHHNVPSSGHQSLSTFNNQSVITHGLEPSSLGVSSSLTITPVKPSTGATMYYQQAKTSAHTNVQSNTSVGSHGNSNTRSDVIVTPSSSSSMPHIKSTNVNFNVSSANSVSNSNNYSSSHAGGNNFSTSHSSNNFSNSRVGGNAYQSSHGASGNGFSTSLSSSDVSGRTHRTMLNVNDSHTAKNHSVDKSNFHQPPRTQLSDSFLSPSMWPPSGPVDIARSSSSSPSSVKSVTPSPEKAMVSRKDRILQESRERPGSDPMMPTLSGPYRSSHTPSDHSNASRNLTQAKAASQNLLWDDELFIIEDFLKMSSPSSSIPQNTHKVPTASTDSYKHPLPILEMQKCDNSPTKSSLLDIQRSKNITVTTSSEPQRVNVVMHTPHVHNTPKSSSLSYTQHSRDQPRSNTIMSNHAIRDMTRPSSTKSSSSNPDSQRANVVMATPHFQESLRVGSLKDEMSDILAGIPTQMISRTDHYTITNSMPSHTPKRKSLPEISDLDIDMAIGSGVSTVSATLSRTDVKGSQDESLQKAQELAMRGILMSRTNCDGNYGEDPWVAPIKKTVSNVSNKPSNDILDQRLSGMGTLSSSLSMTGLDGMGLGLPSHLVGFQNDYQRHLYGSSSKPAGPNDHRPL